MIKRKHYRSTKKGDNTNPWWTSQGFEGLALVITFVLAIISVGYMLGQSTNLQEFGLLGLIFRFGLIYGAFLLTCWFTNSSKHHQEK